MRNFLVNKSIFVPVIFAFIACFMGGDISDYVLNNAPLTIWLEANKLSIAFKGADFSSLPLFAVMAIIFAISVLAHALFILLLELGDFIKSAEVIDAREKETSVKSGEQIPFSSKNDEPQLKPQTDVESREKE